MKRILALRRGDKEASMVDAIRIVRIYITHEQDKMVPSNIFQWSFDMEIAYCFNGEAYFRRLNYDSHGRQIAQDDAVAWRTAEFHGPFSVHIDHSVRATEG